ncbi:hypothetical protein HU200_063567 [Digitaria exilis]|uniref:Uncharacterized protein n=1 Tax=Digitaria exilis TaxID=1010633 RepID=A0A835ADJ8_9POAL|nr:hypothetical protein HU200_063567 [Digitaria exilis]CAB3488412.1 unnamed protein product [Digitaria exilis]
MSGVFCAYGPGEVVVVFSSTRDPRSIVTHGTRVYFFTDHAGTHATPTPPRAPAHSHTRGSNPTTCRSAGSATLRPPDQTLSMAWVTIVDVSYVAAPPHAAIKLNAMEAQWVVTPVLQHLLLFDADGHLPPFHEAVQSLRSSLAATLATHAPLAGKVHYLADTGEDDGNGCGVRFVVAETDADARRLVRDEDHDAVTFERLVPEVDMSVLPAPVLAVQVTRLGGARGGGLALGLTVHHAVADGRSLWRFVEAWAAACRGDAPHQPPPCFDRSRVRMPGGDELVRTVLRKYAPDLPMVKMPAVLQEDRLRFTRRTFTLDAAQIARLKETIVRVAEEAQGGAPLRRAPSTFVAVVALLWTCAVRGRSIPPDDDVFLFFLADIRGRLDPPAGADYFGTCLAACLTRLPARELHGEGALVTAAAAVQGTIRKMAEDPLGFWPGWEFLKVPSDRTVSVDRLMNVSGSPGFGAYDAGDFGWGKPRRTENVRMNHDGQVALVRARDGGGVQVAVSMLRRDHVDAFHIYVVVRAIVAARAARVRAATKAAVRARHLCPQNVQTRRVFLAVIFPTHATPTPPALERRRYITYRHAVRIRPVDPLLLCRLRSMLRAPDTMASVTIVDVSYVAAPPHAPIKLNAMEAQWHLLLFDAGDDDDGHLPPFDDVVQSLRSSLGATLATHAPLAGKVHCLADTGEVAICSSTEDGGGVRFVVAETDADARRLARDEDHNALTFERLVPEVDMTSLPAPVLAVQATRLGGGGLALGLTVHHAVADGRSLWRFVEAWATTCRGDAPPQPPPCFDRSRVRMPGGDDLARTILRKYAPDLPVVTMPEALHQDRLRFTRRTITLDAPQIARLKETIVRVAEEAQGGAPMRRAPSTFVAVIALVWTCAVRGRSIPPDDDVFLFFFADIRDRLDPPAGADYFGACLTGCLVKLPARELHAEDALLTAAAAVQDTIRKMAEDPLGSWPGWEFLKLAGNRSVPLDRLMNVSGSSGFGAYDAGDFGWGKPRRTENVRMNHDGQVALVRARDGGGGVQVAVSMLRRDHVDAFHSELHKLLG